MLDANNTAHVVPVTIGQDDGRTVQIVSGLKPGDLVIQDPPDSLIEGEKVSPQNPGEEQQNRSTRRWGQGVTQFAIEAAGLVRRLRLYVCWRAARLGRTIARPDLSALRPARVQGGRTGGAVVPPPNPNGGTWKPASPPMELLRGKWWEVYSDPQIECAGRSDCRGRTRTCGQRWRTISRRATR